MGIDDDAFSYFQPIESVLVNVICNEKISSKHFNRDSFTDEKSPIIESSAQNYFCSRPHQLIEIFGGFRGTWVFVANSWLLNRVEMHVKTNSFILFV